MPVMGHREPQVPLVNRVLPGHRDHPVLQDHRDPRAPTDYQDPRGLQEPMAQWDPQGRRVFPGSKDRLARPERRDRQGRRAC